MEDENAQSTGLKQSLSLFDAVAVSVGAIVGGGIFVVTGIAAGLAGSAMIVSMLVAALISLFTASSFAELTAWQPKEGSVYEYNYQLISPFAGFLTGWMWIISNTFAGAAVSLGFAHYLTALFPTLPANITAAVTCLAFTLINYYGMKESARINNILVTAKLLTLVLFIILGAFFIDPSNYTPFTPLTTGTLHGAFYIFFAYGGFARTAVIAEEVKNPRRNVPRAILLALIISTIVYMLVGAIAIGLIGAQPLSQSNSPLKEAINQTGILAATYTISMGGILATASVLLTSILGVSRMTYAMAKRRHLPQTLSKIDPKRSTPHHAIWLAGIAMTLLVLFTDLTQVVAVSTFSMLFYYSLTNVSALRLKTEKRMHPRFFSAVGAATCIAFLAFSLFASTQCLIVGTACLLAGALYYAAKQKLKPT